MPGAVMFVFKALAISALAIGVLATTACAQVGMTAPTTTGGTSAGTAVAGVQTAPQGGQPVTVAAGVQVEQQAAAPAAGVRHLPSTTSRDSTNPLLGLGAVLMALGVFLARRPSKPVP